MKYKQIMHEATTYADESGEVCVVFCEQGRKDGYCWWAVRDLAGLTIELTVHLRVVCVVRRNEIIQSVPCTCYD